MSFDPNRYLNQSVAAVPKSGIRKFFDVAATIPGAISLGVGEPDFVTPYHIRNAAINSILDGETQYTSNWGLLELRQEIAAYVDNRFHISYDPKNEILVTVGARMAAASSVSPISESSCAISSADWQGSLSSVAYNSGDAPYFSARRVRFRLS